MNFFYILIFTLIQLSLSSADDCKGCVSLDEYSFDKIVSKFKAVIVKFDVSYPYGDKEDVYVQLSKDIGTNKDVVVARVGVQDYGDKNNEALAKKYGITKDDFPVVLLFVEGKRDPIPFPVKKEWVIDDFRHFLRDNTNIYIGLPGCIESFDKLAQEFVVASNKEKKLKEAEKMLETQQEGSTAQIYIKLMKKVISDGVQFVQQELARLKKIIKEGKVNKNKMEELSQRMNILHSFVVKQKEEL
ncbi:hypothetical protein RI129_012686 [Pyrocoelia pectoralis]|uniref:Endoplasmic reticulum resident protein 29 n=1 Tax=Pyrocoelia pectoralis TaxID=417401 RepID=A0AAN7ZF54_9COLE